MAPWLWNSALPLVDRVRHTVRRFRHSSQPLGVILSYHRIAEPVTDPWLLCVTPEHFAEHLEIISRVARPVPLLEMVQNVREGRSQRGFVAVTLDDGYADSLYNAKPLLEEAGVPATVFALSTYLTASKEFWWDELDRLLLQPGILPDRLDLEIDGKIHHWTLGAAAHYDASQYDSHRSWTGYRKESRDPTTRQRLYRALYRILRPLDEESREKILEALRDWAGTSSTPRSTHQPISVEELVRLASCELVEIGAHTQTHPVLASLPERRQFEEISDSKSVLERILEKPVRSFAYPYGSRNEYSPATQALVRKAGFKSACSARFDAIWSDVDVFEMPRVTVENWDGDSFQRTVEWLLCG